MDLPIKKWHIYMADLSPNYGTEPGKIRPVVVVQSDLLNEVHPSTIVCPLTTQTDSHARILRIHLRAKEGGLKQASDILVDQVRAIDKRRLLRPMGKIGRLNCRLLHDNLLIILS